MTQRTAPTPSATDLVLHPLVVVALLAWIVNDHVLKAACPGWLTGKLSDAAGLVAFPGILLATVPTRLTRATGLEHAAWLSAALTALVFAAINLDVRIARVVTPIFALLPRVLSDAPPSTWLDPVRHVCDAEDLLVLPFAAVTPWLVARPRVASRSAAAIALIASLLCTGSAHAELPYAEAIAAERRQDTLEVEGDVLAGGSIFEEPSERGRYAYALLGGRIAVGAIRRHARLGVFGEFVRGSIVRVPESYERYGLVHETYRGFAIGVRAGLERRRVRLDGSLVFTGVTDRNRSQFRFNVLPAMRATLGNRSVVAYTAQVGSTDGYLFDGRIADSGIFLERRRISFRFAVGLGLLLGPDIAASQPYDEGITARFVRDPGGLIAIPDPLLDAEMRIELAPKVHLEAWIQGGMQWPRARLGVIVAL